MTEIRTAPAVHGFLIGMALMPRTRDELIADGCAYVLDGTLESFDIAHVLYLRALIHAGVIDPGNADTYFSVPPPVPL